MWQAEFTGKWGIPELQAVLKTQGWGFRMWTWNPVEKDGMLPGDHEMLPGDQTQRFNGEEVLGGRVKAPVPLFNDFFYSPDRKRGAGGQSCEKGEAVRFTHLRLSVEG